MITEYRCEKCDGEIEIKRKNVYSCWFNVYVCKKCGHERLLTPEERKEFNA